MKQILVIDTDPQFLQFMHNLMSAEGYIVETFTDALAALEKLQSCTPDLIFIDRLMPDLPCRDLYRLLRSRPSLYNIPLVRVAPAPARSCRTNQDIETYIHFTKGTAPRMAKRILTLLGQLQPCSQLPRPSQPKTVAPLNSPGPETMFHTDPHGLETVLNWIDEGVIKIDSSGRVIYANAVAADLIGIPAQQLTGTDIQRHLAVAWQNVIRTALDPAEGPGKSCRPPAIAPDSLPLNNRLVTLSLHSAGSEPDAGLLLILRDVSARDQAEQRLRKSETKYRCILQSIEEGYFETDLDGDFTFVNDSMCRMLGLDCHELLGRNYQTYASDSADTRLRATFSAVQRTGVAAVAGDFEMIRKDGKRCILEFSPALREDRRGRAIGFRGIVRDVSERVELQREKNKLHARLGQAQKLEAIGTLAGGIAHDFNNILQAITGSIQLLQRDHSTNEPLYRRLETIAQAANRGSELIGRLMLFGHRKERELRAVNLNDEISHVLKLLERTIPKMIEIELNLAPQLTAVEADALQMEQIIMNLVLNARDAMAEGGRLIFSTRNTRLGPQHLPNGVMADPRISGPAGAKPGAYVCLTVADTGHGMDQPTLERIFEPFFTTKPKNAGTGLGLATVYGIVTSHGGIIDCQSVPGEGARFDIYLPTMPGRVLPATPPTHQTADLPGGTETILLVDDEDVLLELGTEILEDYGYTALCATSGEEALTIYANEGKRIDLVILDVNMPGIGGHKCLCELLKIDPRATVIVSTGYADDEVAQRVIAAGAKGFVGKPYPLKEMLTRVRAVLDAPVEVTA